MIYCIENYALTKKYRRKCFYYFAQNLIIYFTIGQIFDILTFNMNVIPLLIVVISK